jgi:hypothetical protein
LAPQPAAVAVAITAAAIDEDVRTKAAEILAVLAVMVLPITFPVTVPIAAFGMPARTLAVMIAASSRGATALGPATVRVAPLEGKSAAISAARVSATAAAAITSSAACVATTPSAAIAAAASAAITAAATHVAAAAAVTSTAVAATATATAATPTAALANEVDEASAGADGTLEIDGRRRIGAHGSYQQ